MASHAAAVERYLTGAGTAKSSARIYRFSLTAWGWMLAGEPAPTGPARRGAKPPVFPIAAIDDLVLPEVLAELAASRADEADCSFIHALVRAREGLNWLALIGPVPNHLHQLLDLAGTTALFPVEP